MLKCQYWHCVRFWLWRESHQHVNACLYSANTSAVELGLDFHISKYEVVILNPGCALKYWGVLKSKPMPQDQLNPNLWGGGLGMSISKKLSRFFQYVVRVENSSCKGSFQICCIRYGLQIVPCIRTPSWRGQGRLNFCSPSNILVL